MSFAFVVPRYGPQVVGGAESLARHFAEQLVHEGEQVDVFTTCTLDYATWKNSLPVGTSQFNGVNVQRFPVQSSWSRQRHSELHASILRAERLTIDEQFEWVDSGPHSPRLYQALAQQARRFEFVFVIPYPFPISYYAAAIARQHTIIWPCLHDEAYAYLAPTQFMLRKACGLAYNVDAEQQLAIDKLKLNHPASCVVGMGLHTVPYDPVDAAKRFRQETGIHNPFILYAGRNSSAKNVPLLMDYFERYKAAHSSPLKLVLMGSSASNGETPQHPDIVNIGTRDEQGKYDAYAAALTLCQPSLNESLSIVMMEAWQMNTPILVHRDCAVTHAHVVNSGGGLYFGHYTEFEGVIDLLLARPDLRLKLGQAGNHYVEQRYSWSAVMHRFRSGLEIWRNAKLNYDRN